MRAACAAGPAVMRPAAGRTTARRSRQGYFYNHFFETTGESEAFEEIYLAAPVPEITVRDLAETGRNAHFADIVGPCDLRTSVAPARMTVGQPALFTVHLDNLAFARHINGLPSAAFDGLRSEFQLSREPIRENATDNARSFTHVLRPLHAGDHTHPGRRDSDVRSRISGAYRTLRSEPIPITVEVDQDDGSRAFTPRIDSESPIRLHGVRHNRLERADNDLNSAPTRVSSDGFGGCSCRCPRWFGLLCCRWCAAGSVVVATRFMPAPWPRGGDSAGRLGATKNRLGGSISPTGSRSVPRR